MAGGSSDAAAVLFGMNRMYDLGLSMEELMQRGVKIGADVPYCIMRGTALAEGIGEPGIGVSTRFVFENLKANELESHPDIDGMLDALKNQDLKALAGHMTLGNVLETVTIPAYPVIQKLKDAMIRLFLGYLTADKQRKELTEL